MGRNRGLASSRAAQAPYRRRDVGAVAEMAFVDVTDAGEGP
ncbi:hypothetical protein HUW46_09162 [Amycolatopsis sp. CA-230715]|nr:hypothetical protein HUW46_09162 [Amycolatopsis sp. CA-230715]